MDVQKFKASLVLRGYNNKSFIEASGINKDRYYKVLRKETSFNQSELNRIRKLLVLNNDEFVSIFFE